MPFLFPHFRPQFVNSGHTIGLWPWSGNDCTGVRVALKTHSFSRKRKRKVQASNDRPVGIQALVT